MSKIVTVYIVYDLDAWPRNLTNDFLCKNCLCGETNTVKKIQSFDNDTARDVVIFAVDNSSSSHSDNHKNNILVLGEGPKFQLI